MGSSQSTRKLTIVNDEDDVNVIKISDAVAKRLSKGVLEEASATESRPREAKPTLNVPLSNSVNATPAVAQASASTFETYYPQFTISALEMQQQKEKELATQEDYWKHRLLNVEKQHEKINRTMEEEYKKAVKIFDDSKVVKVQNSVRPCQETSKKVLNCYQNNPKETLRCADLVQQFTNCVDERRAALMQCQ